MRDDIILKPQLLGSFRKKAVPPLTEQDDITEAQT